MKKLLFFLFNFYFVYICQSALVLSDAYAAALRDELQDKGVSFEAVYTVDYFSNTQGGIKRGDTYLTNLDITLDVDTEKLGLWDNGQFFIYGLHNSGDEKLTGEIVGDLQTISNIEAPRTSRIYELWYQHFFLDDQLSILLGFHDYNSEFNVTEYGSLYINSSFGIQPDISAGARPSVFPLAAPGIRLKTLLNEQWELLFAVYDGDPGDPDISEHFPRSDLDRSSGAFIATELAFYFHEQFLPGFIKLGLWNNSGEVNDVVDLNLSGDPIERNNNMGGYLIIDKQLYRESEEQGLGGFVQFGMNDKRVNEVNIYVGGGFNYRGLVPGRDEDEAGIAVAHAVINKDVVDAGGRDDFETTIEATYNIQINDKVRIQPDIQYIFNPGAVKGFEDAIVAGVRVELSL